MENDQVNTAATVSRDLITLCACAVNGTAPDTVSAAAMDLPALYKAAQRHMLTSVVAFALEAAGIRDAAFSEEKAKAIRKMALMDVEQVKVLSRLEEAGIWYMPLKGAVLKDLYPAFGMREMSDRDILVDPDRTADVRRIMEDLGFTTREYGKHHHDCYVKPPVSNFEMHHQLFGGMQGKQINAYFADVKSRLVKDDGNSYGWHFSPEDFYLHMLTHEYKHYSAGGTGLRSLLDTYVYLKTTKLDLSYVRAEAEKLGIADFEQRNRELALCVFGGETSTEKEQKMLDHFLRSGTYGNSEYFAENQLAEKGRWSFFLSRLTLPYDVMREEFPVLQKAPFLYPFIWVYRLVAAVILRGDIVKHQISALLTWKEDNDP